MKQIRDILQLPVTESALSRAVRGIDYASVIGALSDTEASLVARVNVRRGALVREARKRLVRQSADEL